MDLNKLSQADRVVGGSAIALLIFSFLPWYGVDYAFGSASRSGWDYFLFGIIPVILGILMAGQIALTKFSETKLPDLPISWGQAHLIAGCIAGALVLLKLAIGDDVAGFDLDRKYGLFLSVVAAIGLAGGGFLKSREASETPTV